MDKIITVVGPTAVGKTALSFALADYFHTELISGDAYQIYRHMNIGTAKPTTGELQRYTHHLINIADPDESYSAAMFCRAADIAVKKINHSGRIPVLVGGTGLYVQSLLEGYHFDGAGADEAMRTKARMRSENATDDELMAYIKNNTGWQPPDWNELFANKHRLIRLLTAIESGEGKQFVHAGKEQSLIYDAFVIGLSLQRNTLYDRIEKRVDVMLRDGWIEEVRSLLEHDVTMQCQSMKAIGYEEITEYLQQHLSKDDMADKIKQRTRRFAKRQLTWYKRMPYIHWFRKEEYESERDLADAVISAIGKKWNI